MYKTVFSYKSKKKNYATFMSFFSLCLGSNAPHLSRASQKINWVPRKNIDKVKRGVGENGFNCTAQCDIFVA